MTEIRYGLIGAGMMGQEHIRNLALLEGATVAALADPDDAMRHQSADLAGAAARAFGDYRDLLSWASAEDSLDALIIASPNHTHAGVLDDVLATPLPVLVEKPLCTTSADCVQVQERSAARMAPVWVAMEYRYIPPVAEILRAVQAGEIGQPHMLTIREHRFPFLEKVGDWNRFNRYTGGTLVEKCCHFFDLMRLFAGADPTRVFAVGGQAVNHLDESYQGERPDILDNAMVTVAFENGMNASLELCMFADGAYFQEDISVIGDAAKIEAKVPGPARFWPGGEERAAEVTFSPRDPKGPQDRPVAVDAHILEAGDHHGSTYYQHERFRDLIRAGSGQPDVTVEDGLWSVRMGEAAERSIQTGEAIRF